MKMPAATFDKLSKEITPLDNRVNRDRYRRRDIPNADRVTDIDKRYRWDLFYASVFRAGIDLEGLNDSHIDTALRRIVKPL